MSPPARRSDSSGRVRPALFDLLVDPESEKGYDGDQLRQSIRRDLDYLLNTRRPSFDTHGFNAEEAGQLKRSVLGYGLTEYKTPREDGQGLREMTEEEIADHIRETIETYEPRLKNIRVEITDVSAMRRSGADSFDPLSVGLQIFAELAREPFGRVAYQTIVELTRGRTVVAAAEDSADERATP